MIFIDVRTLKPLGFHLNYYMRSTKNETRVVVIFKMIINNYVDGGSDENDVLKRLKHIIINH